MSKPFSFEEFKEVYSKVPRLCVDLVIRSEQGTILSLRSIPPHEGKWHLPGGTVYFKEKLENAARRTAMEELGIEIEVGDCLGYMEFLHLDNFGGFDHPVSLVFDCTPLGAGFRVDEQPSEIRFFKSLPELILPEHKSFLEKLG